MTHGTGVRDLDAEGRERVFFTGDTHFRDDRVLKIDRRPFADMAAHDEALIAAWNAAVGPDDLVWHLGDFAKGDAAAKAEILDRLSGEKHLILGNNDDAATADLPGWASVAHYAEIRHRGHHVVMCHYPFRTWNGKGKGSLDFHGHSHGALKPDRRQFDVGVDARDYRPVDFDAVTRGRLRRAAAVS